ncbi:MAG: hypothetical protein NC311_03800 [Muribaculaceae bacterium]|nr:hypothetical protein [Muribaculaceae bacterium]
MAKLIWGFLFMCLYMPAYAGTIGDSHNDRNAVGRARANVVYNSTIVAQPQQQTPVSDIEPVDINESVESEPEIIPEPILELEPDLSAEIAMASQYIAELHAQINNIDSEIACCKSAKRNWTIGTVIGGAGVIGTATGAIVQAVQINKAKKNGATEESDNTNENKDDAQ